MSKISCKILNIQYLFLQTRINVVSRETGKLYKVFHSEAFFYLHIIHQFEQEDYIILDICVYEDPSMINCMYVESLKVTFNQNKLTNIFEFMAMRNLVAF